MYTDVLLKQAVSFLNVLCRDIQDRSVGSEGNRKATSFFRGEAAALGWEMESQKFDAVDWVDGGAQLDIDNKKFEVRASPYSPGCDLTGDLAAVSTIDELSRCDLENKIAVLHGNLAKEQLMPKNFVFYNPERHQQIISLLEAKRPAGIVCVTGRNASLAGGVYPFPLIEDGDFNIPSVYMTEEEGREMLLLHGKPAHLESVSRRIPGKGYNVTGRKGGAGRERIVVTAHIDAKKGTPGAIDNATGVVILLLLAGLLIDHTGTPAVEIAALNGEDYYAVPGQMLYIKENLDRFDEISLNINIDGAGYKEGKSALSFYGVPEGVEKRIKAAAAGFDGIAEGPQWPQGDHSIFIHYGVPAVAVSSEWFTENIDSQTITHTPKDSIKIVDPVKLVEIARFLKEIVTDFGG